MQCPPDQKQEKLSSNPTAGYSGAKGFMSKASGVFGLIGVPPNESSEITDEKAR